MCFLILLVKFINQNQKHASHQSLLNKACQNSMPFRVCVCKQAGEKHVAQKRVDFERDEKFSPFPRLQMFQNWQQRPRLQQMFPLQNENPCHCTKCLHAAVAAAAIGIISLQASPTPAPIFFAASTGKTVFLKQLSPSVVSKGVWIIGLAQGSKYSR